MDSGIMSIVDLYSGMRQIQVQTAVQTSLLRMTLDNQVQAIEELLNSTLSPQAPLNPPYLGQNIDIVV